MNLQKEWQNVNFDGKSQSDRPICCLGLLLFNWPVTVVAFVGHCWLVFNSFHCGCCFLIQSPGTWSTFFLCFFRTHGRNFHLRMVITSGRDVTWLVLTRSFFNQLLFVAMPYLVFQTFPKYKFIHSHLLHSVCVSFLSLSFSVFRPLAICLFDRIFF